LTGTREAVSAQQSRTRRRGGKQNDPLAGSLVSAARNQAPVIKNNKVRLVAKEQGAILTPFKRTGSPGMRKKGVVHYG